MALEKRSDSKPDATARRIRARSLQSVAVGLLTLALGLCGCDGRQRYAAVGPLTLVSGEVLESCSVGYRTQGDLDSTASNAVLVLTWLGGRSSELLGDSSAAAFLRDESTFVILVDALANGVSCSPSRRADPERPFPQIAIGDMVESQRALLDQLGVRRLRAVVGTSMGGMQALEWGARYPDRVDGVIALASTPGLGPSEKPAWQGRIEETLRRSPARRAWTAGRAGRFAEAVWHLRTDPEDWHVQAQAILDYSLADHADGDLAEVARRLPPLLLIVSSHDPVFDPERSRELATLAGGDVVVLDGRCGHAAPGCEHEAVVRAISDFVERLSARRRADPTR